jgi:hypothetical protein
MGDFRVSCKIKSEGLTTMKKLAEAGKMIFKPKGG